MSNINVFYSKKSDDWRTPSDIYLAYMEKGFLDPCPYQSKVNGLLYDFCDSKLFINPPFSQMKVWIDWAIKQYKNGNIIHLLIPARTDTKYFHELLKYFPIIIFIKGRLHYNDSEKNAPFPSMIVILEPRTRNRYYSLEKEDIIQFIRNTDLWVGVVNTARSRRAKVEFYIVMLENSSLLLYLLRRGVAIVTKIYNYHYLRRTKQIMTKEEKINEIIDYYIMNIWITPNFCKKYIPSENIPKLKRDIAEVLKGGSNGKKV